LFRHMKNPACCPDAAMLRPDFQPIVSIKRCIEQ
jgi:hypothetical protein